MGTERRNTAPPLVFRLSAAAQTATVASHSGVRWGTAQRPHLTLFALPLLFVLQLVLLCVLWMMRSFVMIMRSPVAVSLGLVALLSLLSCTAGAP